MNILIVLILWEQGKDRKSREGGCLGYAKNKDMWKHP